MNSTFYLPRSVSINDKTYSEDELISSSNYVVLLAEPGAGKTELMGSLAEKLGTTVFTASRFSYVGTTEKDLPLVIDAFDELAKVDTSSIYKLLSQAIISNPSHVYLSSRSSEWDSANTNAFKEFFGQQPLLVRLCEFTEAEQRKIFDHHLPGEDFDNFQIEVARFDLDTLLPNPQFLKLFADAYIESERHFTDKRSIFAQAVDRLAKEANPNIKSVKPTLSSVQKVDVSSEVFAKLLLSGSEGVCTSEANENRMFPLLASLFNVDTVYDGILATRLFKLGEMADQHRPVHKIVSEYCAADYLIKRIADPADPLSLQKCLPIIAPNSTVRDELRGLLGWMAALGNSSIEKCSIELDPYAVLANGDPSQLEHSSKCLLIHKLKEIETQDPYFRREDSWRRFSVAGFFTEDVIEDIKPLLVKESEGHLRDLILELLAGTAAIELLRDELRQLILTPSADRITRSLANSCLLDTNNYDYRTYLSDLISEATNTSLNIAAETIDALSPETIDREFLLGLFRACTTLYPAHKDRFKGEIGSRFFITRLISSLPIETTVWLLDELTKDISCTCEQKPYACECRNGISKIVGYMLDRYFELATPPFDPLHIWGWVGNLNFHDSKTTAQSKAVEVLQNNDDLRQGIITHVFGKMTDRDEILETRLNKFDWHSHSGLSLRQDDYKFIVDLAFETNNQTLWASFMAGHYYYQRKKDLGPDDLRRCMREQALEKPEFMQEWAKANRDAKQQFKQDNHSHRISHNRRMERRRRKEENIRTANKQFIQDNKDVIEGGRHWRSLVHFADLALMSPEKILSEVGNEEIVRNALRNCLDFLEPEIPDLAKLAELQCESKSLYAERILAAACVEIIRYKGNLEGIDLRLLRALRTNIPMGYSAVSNEECDVLKAEVDRLIFADTESAGSFLREYLEPQLAVPGCKNPEVWMLRSEDAFCDLRASLSIEWLQRFRDLDISPLSTLFEIAAQYGEREDLKKVIANYCLEYMSKWPNRTENKDIENKRTFWFLRAFYFLDEVPNKYWEWLAADKEIVIELYEKSGRISYRDIPHWPKLTSVKVETILNSLFCKWPKVELPDHWGTGSPIEETAYRFLTEVIWLINSDDPDEAIPVLDRLLADQRFTDLHKSMKSIHSSQLRKKALRDFEAPSPQEIVNRLDHDAVVTVEGLRQLVLEELQDFQKDIDGGEFNSADRFYEKGERLGENRSTEIIAERLNLRLVPQGISVTPEHQLKAAKRSDFTATKLIGGKRRLLVTEVKGQWHRELYTAASAQLHERYSIHPDAEQQGIYLAIWFGKDEKVAGLKGHSIKNAHELKSSIESSLPQDLIGLIDVFVLDVSKSK